MATRAGIDASIVNRLDDDHVFLGMAVKMEFDTADIRIWGGDGDLTLGGETYTGAGVLLQVDNIEETQELKSSGVSLSLAGMDDDVLNMALTEKYQNRPMTIFLVFTMGGGNAVAGSMLSFRGRMLSMTVNDDPAGSTISLTAENRLVDLNRPSNFRYTNASQQHLASGDTSFRYVQQMEDLKVSWGKAGADQLMTPEIYRTHF